MSKKPKVGMWSGLTAVTAVLTAGAIVGTTVAFHYTTTVNNYLDADTYKIIKGDSDEDTEYFKSDFTSDEERESYEAELCAQVEAEGAALLKNDNNALPLASGAKVSLFGHGSVDLMYGGTGSGSVDTSKAPNFKQALEDQGIQINSTLWDLYSSDDMMKNYSRITPAAISDTLEANTQYAVNEAPWSKLSSAESSFADYGDAAIVVFSRSGGEGADLPSGENGTNDSWIKGQEGDGNYLALSAEEKELLQNLKTLKDNGTFKKIIVLINSSNAIEMDFLNPEICGEDYGIDSAMWIGDVGQTGINGVAQLLAGEVTPSGSLVDSYLYDNMANPAIYNFYTQAYPNAADYNLLTDGPDVQGMYSVYQEGIYLDYRYYETRYEDTILGQGNADSAVGTKASTDGWNYAEEVCFPFGYGLSYTTFEQTLDSVTIADDKKTATVTVTVKNTGDVAGKSVVEVYASVPYTDYDRQNGVEKAAVQLMDFEKTSTLQPGASQTITMKVDLANLASYDANGAKTYIVDPGDYYFAIGTDAHDALNNVLAAQGKTVTDGMTADGNAAKTYKWTWTGDVDKTTFAVGKNGTAITNQLTEGDYAMDYNAFEHGTVTYLSRADWNGTFPKTYSGLTANATVSRLLNNDLYTLKTDDDVSDLIFGDTTSTLTINDMKNAPYDDPRWEELVNKVTVAEFLDFSANAFHNIQGIASVNMPQKAADDGPGGSDSHYLNEGGYQGVPYADAADYTSGTRVAPSPVNLAYAWNKELAFENGEIILGESTLVLDLPIMIGPGMNIHRHAYNARGVEYYSEDPILSGYVGSAVVQGAQSKGTLVNIKHMGFNDQEINRSGVAVFMNEQKARELELRNLQQAFEGNGKPASFEGDATKDNTYTSGARGVMTSYNRHGAVAASANVATMVNILQGEWGFHGYNVTDFTGVSLKAAPKESLLAGTTNFCGFGASVDYWNAEALSGDRAMLLAIKNDIHNALYALANSAMLNGVKSTTVVSTVEVMTPWRVAYTACEYAFGALAALSLVFWVVSKATSKGGRKA